MNKAQLISTDSIQEKIYLIRGKRIMLGADLARLYEVAHKALIQAVRRNLERFPRDFMFQLTEEELNSLRSQIVTLEKGRGRHSKYLPYAFTEQGVAMLSAVLHSDRAVRVSIEIVRTFVKLREFNVYEHDLVRRIDDMEKKYDGQFQIVFKAIRQLIGSGKASAKRRIGFHNDRKQGI